MEAADRGGRQALQQMAHSVRAVKTGPRLAVRTGMLEGPQPLELCSANFPS
jgi:hypothetical protein